MNTLKTQEKQKEYNDLVIESKLEDMPPAVAFFDYGLDIKITFLRKVIEDNKKRCSEPGSAKVSRDGSMYFCEKHPDGIGRGWHRGFSPYGESATTIQKCTGCPKFQIRTEEEE